MKKIQLFDTTLRDGEQSPGVNLNTVEKLQIAKQLEKLGVDIIEAGFAASSDGDFEAVQKIARTIKDSTIVSLARTNKADIDAAYGALKGSADGRIHLFIATSDIHMKHKLRMSREQVLEAMVESVRYAKKYFPVIQVSAEDATRTDRAFLAEFSQRAIEAGANIINIPDTVGYIQPEEYYDLFSYLQKNVPLFREVNFSCHCHDDLGLAVANSLAAIRGGVSQVECTINGIGERAGNASLEEIALALYTRKDLYQADTNTVLNEIKKTSTLVSQLSGMAIQKNKAIVGANAFLHASGIHQDGILKEVSTYEIISPELVGVDTNKIVLGKLSGRHAFADKLEQLGYELTKEDLAQAFRAFKKLADSKKDITDDDLHVLVVGEQVAEGKKYDLEQLHVNYHSSGVQTATVSIKDQDGTALQDAATGNGSIEAIYNAIDRILHSTCTLKDYRIQSITQGQDALAQVHVVIEENGKSVSGFGVAYDVLEASAKAYVYAIGKLKEHQKLLNR